MEVGTDLRRMCVCSCVRGDDGGDGGAGGILVGGGRGQCCECDWKVFWSAGVRSGIEM